MLDYWWSTFCPSYFLWPEASVKGGTTTMVSLHSSAASCKARATVQHLEGEKLEVIPHPPNSPDLAPCDLLFFSFSTLRIGLADKTFLWIQDLQRAVNSQLYGIPPFEYWLQWAISPFECWLQYAIPLFEYWLQYAIPLFKYSKTFQEWLRQLQLSWTAMKNTSKISENVDAVSHCCYCRSSGLPLAQSKTSKEGEKNFTDKVWTCILCVLGPALTSLLLLIQHDL